MTVVHEFDVEVSQQEGFLFELRFDKPDQPVVLVDEPPPLGHDRAGNPSRMLAGAIGSCLAASFLFCVKRHAKLDLQGVRAQVHVEIVRNEQKRQRIGKVSVKLHAPLASDDPRLSECRELFEDFCTVTQSVRKGITVDVELEGEG